MTLIFKNSSTKCAASCWANKLDDNFHDDEFIRAETQKISVENLFFPKWSNNVKTWDIRVPDFHFLKKKKIQTRRGFEPPSTSHYTSPFSLRDHYRFVWATSLATMVLFLNICVRQNASQTLLYQLHFKRFALLFPVKFPVKSWPFCWSVDW